MILVMLVYYGLVIVIVIALLIYLYDYTYNSNDEAFGNNSPFNENMMIEFKTEEELIAS
jgi:heme/copper-type cytochrome/quinol oxidase subunit 2